MISSTGVSNIWTSTLTNTNSNIQSISLSSQPDVSRKQFPTFFVLRVKLYDVSTNCSFHAPPLAISQMASFVTVSFLDEFLYGKKLRKHQSHESPPAYIITVPSGCVAPISYCTGIKKTCYWERPLIDYESWEEAPCGHIYQLSDCYHSHLKFCAVYEWEWECVCVLISTFQ